jgi:hypothetical protein
MQLAHWLTDLAAEQILHTTATSSQKQQQQGRRSRLAIQN